MSTFRLAFAAAVMILGVVAHAEDWRKESDEAAELLLRKGRAATGELCRFEISCLVRRTDSIFGTETRRIEHVYFEAPFDAFIESRPFDRNDIPCSRDEHGRRLELRATKAETRHWSRGSYTVVDEESRTYSTDEMDPAIIDRSRQPSFLELLFDPRVMCSRWVPPWLDPDVAPSELQSRYRVAEAASRSEQFSIRLTLRNPKAWPTANLDDRLEGDHTLILDPRTGLPKKWNMRSRHTDQTVLYTRFDLNPPHRKLAIDLSKYQKLQPPPPPIPPSPAEVEREAKAARQSHTLWELSLRTLASVCLR